MEELKDTGSQMPDCGLAEVTRPMTMGTPRSVLVCGEEVNTLGSEEAMGGQSQGIRLLRHWADGGRREKTVGQALKSSVSAEKKNRKSRRRDGLSEWMGEKVSGSRPGLSDKHNGILGEGRPHLQERTFLNSTLKPLLKISSGGRGGDTEDWSQREGASALWSG